MQKLPFDIILNIYFLTNDYTTLLNLFVLNKHFYYYYLKSYTKTYYHKYQVLFFNIFSFLHMLPKLDEIEDLYILTLTECCMVPYIYRDLIKNDIIFIYKLYKNFLFNQIQSKFSHRFMQNIGKNLINQILIQGPIYLNNNIYIKFNKQHKNHVSLYLPSSFELNNSNYSPLLILNLKLLLFEELIERTELI